MYIETNVEDLKKGKLKVQISEVISYSARYYVITLGIRTPVILTQWSTDEEELEFLMGDMLDMDFVMELVNGDKFERHVYKPILEIFKEGETYAIGFKEFSKSYHRTPGHDMDLARELHFCEMWEDHICTLGEYEAYDLDDRRTLVIDEDDATYKTSADDGVKGGIYLKQPIVVGTMEGGNPGVLERVRYNLESNASMTDIDVMYKDITYELIPVVKVVGTDDKFHITIVAFIHPDDKSDKVVHFGQSFKQKLVNLIDPTLDVYKDTVDNYPTQLENVEGGWVRVLKQPIVLSEVIGDPNDLTLPTNELTGVLLVTHDNKKYRVTPTLSIVSTAGKYYVTITSINHQY